MPNLLYRVRHQRAGRWIFLWARPMHQGGRNGATNPLFRSRKSALTSVVSKVSYFSNKKKLGNLEKNAQSTIPGSASTCRAMDFFYGNFLGLLRVTECHRAHGHKNSVDIFMRVSARAKNVRQRRPVANNGRQRRPVQHKNRRRARFGVRLVRHPVKVQRRWRAVACWQCTRASVIIRFSSEEIVECHG